MNKIDIPLNIYLANVENLCVDRYVFIMQYPDTLEYCYEYDGDNLKEVFTVRFSLDAETVKDIANGGEVSKIYCTDFEAAQVRLSNHIADKIEYLLKAAKDIPKNERLRTYLSAGNAVKALEQVNGYILDAVVKDWEQRKKNDHLKQASDNIKNILNFVRYGN